jgi:PAS domain S-box-containing protein
MKDQNKTKKELIRELEELRRITGTNGKDGASERKKVYVDNENDQTVRDHNEQELKITLEHLSKKNRYEETISTVTRSVHSSIDPHEVVENAVEAMNKNIDGADNVSIYFIEGDEAVIQAWRGYPDWFIKSVERIPKPKGFTWKVLGEGKLIYCPDVEKDNVIGKLGKKVGTKSYASMPIKHGDKTIGSININSFKKNAFDIEDLKLLDIIANQVAIAINNARQTDALRESEERYRTLYDQSPIGVYIFNTDLVITNTNEHHAETLKIPRDKIIGTALRKLKDQTFTRLHEDTLKGGSGCQEGLYRATSSSVELWLFVSVAPLRDGAGKIIGGLSVVEDITERKNAEIALRQSEENYESLVNTVEGIVWEADPKTLVFTFISKQAERILGYPPEDWTEDREFWLKKLHPQDRDWAYKICLDATREKRDHILEYRMVAADGKTVWLRDIVTVVKANSEAAGLRGLMVDITDLKNAEDLLKESAEKYRALVEKVQDLIVESSSDGKFLYISPNCKEALGYEPEDMLDKSIFLYIHKDDQEVAYEEFARIIREKTFGKAVFRFQHKNGNWKWFESTGNTYQTVEGDVRCVIVSRDITERKRLEEELFKKQNLESLGVLAGGIAHDFNNLLTSILGNISISKMHLDPKDSMYGRLTEAENASLRAKDLTTQLLTFSKGGAPVKAFVHSLGELIRDTANFAVSGSKVKCEFGFDDEIWPAEVDEGQISQVIHNLIINADQAMPEGGEINIKLQNISLNGSNGFNADGGNYIRITIEDSGIGMTEELKTKIFDPYFTTKQRGSGLGLTTVYSIIKNHEGHIAASSEIGKGTRFDVYLPAAEDIVRAHDTTPNLLKGNGKILVMDDEEAVRNAAGEMIKHLGYKVDYAADGKEAIEKYVAAIETGSPFDAVMIDLTIPGGMGGKEANKRLLEIDPGVKTIVSSGYFNDPVMSEYNKYGFKGVITKPYKIDELSRTIHGVLNGNH